MNDLNKTENKKQRREGLSIEEETCPECYHNKMWKYDSIMSRYKKKCTRCGYREWR